MIVQYTGTSDFQEFSAADFKKADLGQNKLVFANGEPKEVSDEVGQALISSEGIFGDFSFEEVTNDGEEADNVEANRSDSEDSEAGEVDAGATPQQGVDTASAARPAAKKATSTRSR